MATIEIDNRDATPLHAQIERGIRVAIATGRLRSGDQLPTVRQMAVDLRVNANTVARVYLALEREGIVETRRGVGTFIAEKPSLGSTDSARERRLAALVDRFLTDASSLGFSPREISRALARRMKEGD